MDDATVTLLILAAAVALFVANRFPVDVVALATALALYATGVLTLHESLAGFGDPTILFIASLLVVAEALDASGITTWAGDRLIAVAGGGATLVVTLLLALCAVLAAVITPNGAVAALLPTTVVLARRMGRTPSKLLMPVAFSAHAGSLLILTGSPVNVLVSEAAVGADAPRFGFFEFALVGVPLLVGTIALANVSAARLLPDRHARSLPPDLSRHAETLVRAYELDRAPPAHEVPDELFTRRSGVAEVVVAPRSPLIGETVFPGMVTDSGDLVVLSVRRNGEEPDTHEQRLTEGDTLLLQGTWEALEEHLNDDEVLVVDAPRTVRRQAVPLGPGAWRTLVVTGLFVVALAADLIPPAVAGLLAAGALVLLGVLTTEQTYRAMSWTILVLIAGLIPLSEAIRTTGAGDDIARILVDVVGDSDPRVLLAGLFVIAAVLGVAVSNTATALILIPIALSAARDLHVDPRPVLMCVAVACSAPFLAPISTPGNMMVMGPGGYRFGDYWRFGLPLVALFFAVAVFLVPPIWPFQP